MSALDRFFDAARRTPARVILPETDDARIVDATEALARDGLAVPVELPDIRQSHIDVLVAARGITPSLAERMLVKPLIRAAAAVAVGDADAMVAGASNPTRRVIEAAGLAIGLAEGVSVPSSFFLMRFPDGRELVFADCAVTVAPDAAGLAAIARASARSAEALLGQARVALLSYSTGSSGAGDSVDAVRAAAEATGFAGPVQADAALNAAIAAKKGVAAINANVLVFPSLDAGNIAYKLCQELAGAQAVGPFLQGFRKPVCDLSRGARVDDIVAAAVIAGLLR